MSLKGEQNKLLKNSSNLSYLHYVPYISIKKKISFKGTLCHSLTSSTHSTSNFIWNYNTAIHNSFNLCIKQFNNDQISIFKVQLLPNDRTVDL